MSRKPIDQQQPHERREAIWAWIRAQGESVWTIKDAACAIPLEISSIREYLTALISAGYVAVEQSGKMADANLYRLINDCGVDAPRLRKDGSLVTQGQGRLQMWNAMRICKQFSAVDLAFNASTDDHTVSASDAKSYCEVLHKAGYLKVIKPAKPGHKPGTGTKTTYMLIPTMWTGPQPPQIQRTKQIYDPNLRRVVWSKIEGGAE